MWDLIVSVPDHCLSFYFDFLGLSVLIKIHGISAQFLDKV